MAKFKVVEGMHIEGTRRYSKGDVVSSNVDLIKAFPQKFTKVEESDPRADYSKLEAQPAAAPQKAPIVFKDEQDEYKPATKAAAKSKAK